MPQNTVNMQQDSAPPLERFCDTVGWIRDKRVASRDRGLHLAGAWQQDRTSTKQRWMLVCLRSRSPLVRSMALDATLPPDLLPYTGGQLRRGQLILFTGAGFSQNAKNRRGSHVPTAGELKALLWSIC